MDQVKIGRFIKTVRKGIHLTQREVAERLSISEKTVSKWETGNGLPEVSLMLPLCELLGISVNELLSGERLDEKKYFEKAEQNIMSLMEEKAQAKEKIILTTLIAFITVIAAVTLTVVAGAIEMETWIRIVLIAVAAVVTVVGIAVCCVFGRGAGVYECKYCGERFVPAMKAYVWGVHTFTRRKLRCPECGKTGYFKKRLTKSEESL